MPSRVALGAGIAYLVVTSYILAREAGWIPGSIEGVTCGESCTRHELFGISLAWHGVLTMAGAFAIFIAGRRSAIGPWRNLAPIAAVLHGGASLTFSLSQFTGFAALCPECQAASLASVIFAISVWMGAREQWRPAALSGATTAALGAMTAVAILLTFEVERRIAPEEYERVMRSLESQTPPPGAHQAATGLIDPAHVELSNAVSGAAIVGNPDAPMQLVFMADFSCPICMRFLNNDYARLRDAATQSGVFSIRFVLSPRSNSLRETNVKGPMALAAAMAGLDLGETFRAMNAITATAPEQLLRAIPRDRDDEVIEHYNRVAGTIGWERVISSHMNESTQLHRQYFAGRMGTPAFVMHDNTPGSSRPPLALYGYQLADTFLNHAGLTP